MTKLLDYYDICLAYECLQDTDEFYCGTEYEIEDIKEIKLPGYDRMYPGKLSLSDSSVFWRGDIGMCMTEDMSATVKVTSIAIA